MILSFTDKVQKMDNNDPPTKFEQRMDSHEHRHNMHDIHFVKLESKVESLATSYDYRYNVLENKISTLTDSVTSTKALLVKVGFVNVSILMTLVTAIIGYLGSQVLHYM